MIRMMELQYNYYYFITMSVICTHTHAGTCTNTHKFPNVLVTECNVLALNVDLNLFYENITLLDKSCFLTF